MSARAGTEREIYGSYGVCGSPAYDFSGNAQPFAEEYSSPASPPDKKIKRKRQAPLWGDMLRGGAVCTTIAFLLMGSIVANCVLVELSAENRALMEQLDSLRAQRARLSLEHTRTFSPEALETYALEHGDMVRPAPDRTYYIEVPEPQIVEEAAEPLG